MEQRAPELAFRLIGTWWRVDLDSDDAARARFDAAAAAPAAARDDQASTLGSSDRAIASSFSSYCWSTSLPDM